MSEIRKIAAILVTDIVGYSRSRWDKCLPPFQGPHGPFHGVIMEFSRKSTLSRIEELGVGVS